MIFYRDMCGAALDIAPDQALEAIASVVRISHAGQGMPNFRRNGMIMAKHRDLRSAPASRRSRDARHTQVAAFERADFTAVGEKRREDLAAYLTDLQRQVAKFEDNGTDYSRERSSGRTRQSCP